MTARATVHCLDDELSEYAAGRLGAARQDAWEHHLVVCELCRHAVGQERRLRAALAGAPSMPGDLRVTLLALGRGLADEPRPATGPGPLTLLAPSDPPCHRSALRATVVAAAAGGVAAAAAWSLTVIGAPVAPRPGVVSGPAAPSVATARAVSPLAATTVVPVRWTNGTSAPGSTGQRAESTP
jgi:anti-sigma factor RsiW